VVSVEAARHAIGRIADITADKHMEGVRLTRWMLSPIPTFLLWRRMKLWELRSYEQVIKLEQDRLVYQARLHSRFGRAWRRKAPVESIMPLRLARYGVPLAETAPSGLAAAGIEPVLLPAAAPQAELEAAAAPIEQRPNPGSGQLPEGVEFVQEQAEPSSWSAASEPQMMYEGGYDPAFLPGLQAETLPAPDPEAVDAAESFDYAAAYAEYAGRFGDYPNARQFALFLAAVYGLVATETGGPLTEAELRPVLQDLRLRAGEAGESVTDPSFTGTDNAGPMTDPVGHGAATVESSFFGRPSSAPRRAAERVPVPTASAAGVPVTEGWMPEQTARGVASSGSVTVGSGLEPTVWEATVTDTGEATARVPEQLTDTPVGELTEEQRIERVVQWLLEAEAEGKRFPGAEAARRNQVSPKTGQRDVLKAKEIIDQMQRGKGRTHLRSVRSS
ncbi:DUF2637 domain-containing protein, partial [Streptomyces mirabilis]